MVVELVARSERPLPLRDVANLAELNKSTAYRVVRALEQSGFVGRDADTNGYVIGSRLVALSSLVMGKLSVRVMARPLMERLAARTRETVTLHTRHARHRVCVETVEGTQPIRRVVPIGQTVPLHAGPSSKVILAFLPAAEIEAILDRAWSDGDDVTRTRAQLQTIRTTGYLGAVGDRLSGVGALSIPLFDATGVVAALTISGPSDRWDEAAIAAAAPDAVEEAARISRSLGYAGSERILSSGSRT